MLTTLNALAPVFLTILVGLALDRFAILRDDAWRAIEHTCYFVLFPVLLVSTLATADLSGAAFGAIAAALLAAVAVMFALLTVLRPLLMGRLGLSGPSYSSVFQTSTRWHTFVALAIVTALYGDRGLAIGAICVIALVPLLNVVNVVVVTLFADGQRPGTRVLLLRVAQNPIIWSSALGIAINLLAIPVPTALLQTMDLIGRGALGLGLLTVGAGLGLATMGRDTAPIALATVLKLMVMPALVMLAVHLFAIDGLAAAVMIICAGVPTANSGYILARQLGGDATLIAGTITAQIIVSAVTLPVLIWLNPA